MSYKTRVSAVALSIGGSALALIAYPSADWASWSATLCAQLAAGLQSVSARAAPSVETFAASMHKAAAAVPLWMAFACFGIALGLFTIFLRRSDLAQSAITTKADSPHKGELSCAVRACRSAFVGIAIYSGLLNILMLTGSFFMLEVYDRVLPSRSVPTLIGFACLAGGLFVAQALLDIVRARILSRIGAYLGERLSDRAFALVPAVHLVINTQDERPQPVRDLDSVRAFLSGLGPTALFDLPWMPLYLGIIFAFHWWLGVAALIGALVMVALTVLTDILTKAPVYHATGLATARDEWAETSRRNAETLRAMGMVGNVGAKWSAANRRLAANQQRASDVAGVLGATSRIFRVMLQSAILGLGAYLVIRQEASAGIIIASSILSARALAPVDIAIANWKGFVAARQAWHRLTRLLELMPAARPRLALPAPAAKLSVEYASVTPPGESRLLVQDVTFALNAGQVLGVIGPSASGKSSLARLLVGAWPPVRGRICLDGAALDQWQPESLGPFIGYLPQDVELFNGSIAENIARFKTSASDEDVVKAARTAGVHELILNLPNGYDTQVGVQRVALSAGQQQRIALARALYGDPFLIVLDEPNSNLDVDGESALTQAILTASRRGAIVVVIAHRPSALASTDLLLVMHQGRMQGFGPRDEMLRKFARSVPAAGSPQLPFKVVKEAVANP